jgi:hypothetical protein
MRRYNWIWRAPCALSVLVFALGAPSHTAAFSAGDTTSSQRALGNGCSVSMGVGSKSDAGVTLVQNKGEFIAESGGSAYGAGGVVDTPHPAITLENIGSCVGNTDIVINLEQNGADSTFAEDDYIGFTFTLTADAGEFLAGDYEYNVGAGTFPSAGPTVEETQELIARYMQRRASQTIAAQPDLIGFLSGASTGSFNADVTQSNGNFDLATSGDQPVWATLQGSWSEFGTAESSYFFGAVGAHTKVSPDALVGMMFQFDRLTQTDGATSVEGDGYLVGPYFVAKLPNQPLFIEGRLLTGQTDNEVSVEGAATETFYTQRTLASIKVAGQLNYGELVLTPSLMATHLRDEQDAFENTQGNIVAAQGIEVNSVAASLNFAQPVSLSNGELMLTGGISGIWSSSEGTEFASSAAPTTDGQRARITLGASHTLPNGVVLSAGTFYDGIGLNDYESYGLDLGVQMQF